MKEKKSDDWLYFFFVRQFRSKLPNNPEEFVELCLENGTKEEEKKASPQFVHIATNNNLAEFCVSFSQKPWLKVPKTRGFASRWNQFVLVTSGSLVDSTFDSLLVKLSQSLKKSLESRSTPFSLLSMFGEIKLEVFPSVYEVEDYCKYPLRTVHQVDALAKLRNP